MTSSPEGLRAPGKCERGGWLALCSALQTFSISRSQSSLSILYPLCFILSVFQRRVQPASLQLFSSKAENANLSAGKRLTADITAAVLRLHVAKGGKKNINNSCYYPSQTRSCAKLGKTRSPGLGGRIQPTFNLPACERNCVQGRHVLL